MEKTKTQTILKSVLLSLLLLPLLLVFTACGSSDAKVDTSGTYTETTAENFTNYVNANTTTADFASGFHMTMDWNIIINGQSIDTKINIWAVMDGDQFGGMRMESTVRGGGKSGSANAWARMENNEYVVYTETNGNGNVTRTKVNVGSDLTVDDMDSDAMSAGDVLALVSENIEDLNFKSFTNGDVTKFEIVNLSGSTVTITGGIVCSEFKTYFVFENDELTGIQLGGYASGSLGSTSLTFNIVTFDGDISYPSNLGDYEEVSATI